nr:MAG TPA: Regulated-SNARE-like domain [Caudoviricetes sp.]
MDCSCFCVVFLCCCPESFYHKVTYKMLRNTDMVGTGD